MIIAYLHLLRVNFSFCCLLQFALDFIESVAALKLSAQARARAKKLRDEFFAPIQKEISNQQAKVSCHHSRFLVMYNVRSLASAVVFSLLWNCNRLQVFA